MLGSRVVECLGSGGVEALTLSRGGRPGTVRGDLLTSEGLDRAVEGVDTIVHCASNPFRKSRQTDVGGTERLLGAAARTGVSHVIYISIVGIDRAQSYPYYRVKLETEHVIENSPVPHTILRATQFHDFVLGMVRLLEKPPVMLVPRGFLGQSVDVGEVAARLVELALSEPAGRAPDMGGPEVRTLADAARAYLGVTGRRRRIFEVPVPGKTARAFREGALICPDGTRGSVSWEEFLRERWNPATGRIPSAYDRIE